MNRLSIAVIAVLLLAGCGGMDLNLDREDLASRMERDFGGPDGLMTFFESNSVETVRATLAEYGSDLVTEPDPGSDVTVDLISDCPKYFPSSDRNIWQYFNGEYYYIEGYGRPSRAYAYLPPIVAEVRNDTCQASVGQWGDAENPSNDYDGGHMIGSQLGGWGKRANLVPQDANFNRGNWVTLENKMAKCASLPSGRLRYYISVGYPNSTALIPNTFGMQITNQSTGASVSLSFTNTDYGGSNGTYEKDRGVTFLSGQGCN